MCVWMGEEWQLFGLATIFIVILCLDEKIALQKLRLVVILLTQLKDGLATILILGLVTIIVYLLHMIKYF
jgi:hypothetical protein